jgi:putative inorganic carbon (HCO3(-)) transporter
MKRFTLFRLLNTNRAVIIILAVITILVAAASGLVYPSAYAPLVVLGGIIGMIVLVLWVLKPVWALYATIFVLLLPAGSIPDNVASLLNRSMPMVAVGVWAISVIARRRRIFWTSSSIIMLAFVLWSATTILWATNTQIALTFIQLYALRFLLYLFLIPNEIRTQKDLDGLFLTLAVSGWIFIAYNIIGLIQNGYVPGSRFQVLNANENDTGLLLMITLLGVLWWSSNLVPGNRLIKQWGAGIFLLLTVGLTAISGSRGSAISMIIAIAAFSLWRSSRPWARFGLWILLIGMLAFPSLFLTTMNRFLGISRDSLSMLGGREILWQAGLRLISDHPFLGVGIGNASYAIIPYLNLIGSKDTVSLHNPILVIWSETGLPGILLYMSVMVIAVRSFIRQYLRYSELNSDRKFTLYFAIISSIFIGFMASWFKGGSMEISNKYFLLLSLLLIPAGLDLNTLVQSSTEKISASNLDDKTESRAK